MSIKNYTNKMENTNDGKLNIWFNDMILSDLKNINRLKNVRNNYLENIEKYKLLGKSTKYLEEQYKYEYYNQLRVVTELYYKIRNYLLDMKKFMKKEWKKFVVAIYEKMKELYNTVYGNYLNVLLRPKTIEEKRVVRILLEEMQKMENMLIPLLPKKYTAKHLIRCVTEDYYIIRKSKNHILFVYDE